MQVEAGQKVTVDGHVGTVEKVMKLTAKVNFGGKVRIVPLALIESSESGEQDADTIDEGNTRESTVVEHDTLPDEDAPAHSVSKSEKVSRRRIDNTLEKISPKKKQELAKAKVQDRSRSRSVRDEVTELLLKHDDAEKAYNAVLKHPAKKYLNMVAMDALKEQVGTLGGGLFRMRLGNILRAAVRRQAKVASK